MGRDGEKFLTTHHERDIETGLDNRGARFYDAEVGRFLSLDPWAQKFPSWSSYNYVFSNPNTLNDPTGKGPIDFITNLMFKYAEKKIAAKNNNREFASTVAHMKPIEVKSQGKDVLKVGLGLGKDVKLPGGGPSFLKIEGTISVFVNSKTGPGIEAKLNAVNPLLNAETSVRMTQGNDGKPNIESNNDINTASFAPNQPSDEVEGEYGPVKGMINPKETSNVFEDALNTVKEYVKASFDKGTNPQNDLEKHE